MTAAADWLSGERPPLPRREKAVIFDEEFADRFESATLELPLWPPVDQDVPVDLPTVEFCPVKPRRFSRRWFRENLSWKRQVAGGGFGGRVPRHRTRQVVHVSPQRIQRKRTAGWRKPDGAVCVTRPSIYGNPFRVGVPYCGPTILQANTPAETVTAFRDWIMRDTLHPLFWDRELIVAHAKLKAALARGDLVGRDLACWCPIGQPCYGDVLLELSDRGAA